MSAKHDLFYCGNENIGGDDDANRSWKVLDKRKEWRIINKEEIREKYSRLRPQYWNAQGMMDDLAGVPLGDIISSSVLEDPWYSFTRNDRELVASWESRGITDVMVDYKGQNWYIEIGDLVYD